MKVISVSNFKGGVGKTAVTRNLAQELASRGKSVLCIDMDHQGNLSELMSDADGTCIADKVADQGRSISNVLIPDFCAVGELPLRDCIYCTSDPNIDIVPSDLGFIKGNDTTLDNPLRLRKHIRSLTRDGGKRYDVVLIDTRPDLDRKTTLSYIASDYVVVPVEYNRHLIRGLETTLSAIEGVAREYDLDLEYKVLPNKVKTNNRVDEAGATALRAYFEGVDGLFSTSIHQAAALNEASLNGVAVCDFRSNSRAAEELSAVCDELVAWTGVE